jgi:hypothetical protein
MIPYRQPTIGAPVSDLVVKFPSRMRGSIEQEARAEFLPVPDFVRSVVERAIFERRLRKQRQDQK